MRRNVLFYYHQMNTSWPMEFLTLPMGEEENCRKLKQVQVGRHFVERIDYFIRNNNLHAASPRVGSKDQTRSVDPSHCHVMQLTPLIFPESIKRWDLGIQDPEEGFGFEEG